MLLYQLNQKFLKVRTRADGRIRICENLNSSRFDVDSNATGQLSQSKDLGKFLKISGNLRQITRDYRTKHV